MSETAAKREYPDGFRVITIGSGAPGVSLKRGNPATLVQYQDKYFLVDCGYGACRTLVKNGIEIYDIRNILITHQHEDHNADFMHLLLAGWYDAKNSRTEVNIVGPQTKLLYENTYKICEDDIVGRIEVGSRQKAGINSDGISTNVGIYDLTEDDVSLKLDGVAIDAHKISHGNMQSYSYRFTADNKSVVVTGDVAYTDDLADFYKGTDLLVVDAMTLTGFFSMFTEDMIEKAMGNTHMSQRQIGKVLMDSGAKDVILTHIGGDFIDFDASAAYFRSIGFEGEIYGAYDGMTVDL